MKLRLLLIFIVINSFFSYSLNKISPRKLEGFNILGRKVSESDRNKDFIFVGFGGYLSDQGEINFNVSIVTNNYFQFYEKLYLSILLEYQNKTSIIEEILCTSQKEKDPYSCVLPYDTAKLTKVELNDKNIKFSDEKNSKNLTIKEDQFVFSSLAQETMKDISSQNETLEYDAFNLTNIIIKNNEVRLMGKILFNNISDINHSFIFPDNGIVCFLSSDEDEITFNLTENFNEYLTGKMVKNEENFYILFLGNKNIEDLVIYSKNKGEYADLLNFGDYHEPTDKTDASTKAYFRGTINLLKKYIKFKVNITFSNLRALQSSNGSKEWEAFGKRDAIDNIDNGLVKYTITFPNTLGKSILKIESTHDFEFSDDNKSFVAIGENLNIIPKNPNLTNKEKLDFIFCTNIGNKPETTLDSFSFNFNVQEKLENLNKSKAYLNYKPMDSNERDEIQCSVENYISEYRIKCKPYKDVYTFYNSLMIKTEIKSDNGLRNLETVVNKTFYAPSNAKNYISFDYEPIYKAMEKNIHKKKGLSAGAIIAIIFATIAAISAVVFAIICLKKMGVNPPVNPKIEENIQNSSINIMK